MPPRPTSRLTALAAILSAGVGVALAQSPFTLADTLRGSLSLERLCYDVRHYDLALDLYPADSTLAGTVRIAYERHFAHPELQLDLAERLEVTAITRDGAPLPYRRVGDAVFVADPLGTADGTVDTLVIGYRGRPQIARNPPWDGGLVWRRDSLGRVFAGVSCEGIGASIWWPNKDHLSDEPDSVRFSMSAPSALRVVSNGQFRGTTPEGDRTRYHYATTYPINNYNVTFYAGYYARFADTLRSPARETPLAIEYQVLDYNLARARRHFRQVKPMLRCYERALGPYPFWRDGYRVVEAPYLGMEHQSAIAYGNQYMRGYLGRLIPEDMDWDYLLVHESGHEYFGNAVSVGDHAEMWLHESFTTYLEALYVECRYGRGDYARYLASQRDFLLNERPIVGPLGVNFGDFGGSDHYFKGSWVLHTFRTLVGDEAFMGLLRDFYESHAIGRVTTADWLDCVAAHFGDGYAAFWRQYLYEAAVPKLHVLPTARGGSLAFFSGTVPGFAMDLRVGEELVRVTDQPTASDVPLSAWGGFRQNDYLLTYDIRAAPE